MKKSLQSSEWVLVVSLLIIMTSLVVIAKVNAYRAASTLSAKELQIEEILVTVSGAVAKPGEYRVPAGTLVEAVLRKARPKPYANLKDLPTTVEAPLNLFVDELREITVFVQGAVQEPMQLTLPAKSRVSDLKSKVVLSAEADKRFFRRRRMLKEGEKIEVPKKTVE